jgi:hypothetical protein
MKKSLLQAILQMKKYIYIYNIILYAEKKLCM